MAASQGMGPEDASVTRTCSGPGFHLDRYALKEARVAGQLPLRTRAAVAEVHIAPTKPNLNRTFLTRRSRTS